MKFFASFFNQRPSPRPHRRRRGSAVVETALCLTFVLLPLTLGGLQFGMVMMTTHAMQQVTREAGRFAAVHYSDTTFNSDENQGNAPDDEASLKHIIRDVAAAQGIPWNDIKTRISVSPPVNQRTSGQPITITVVYPMKKRAILGDLFFKADEKNPGSKLQAFNFGVFQNDFPASSTFLME